jgi:hypothetical protein
MQCYVQPTEALLLEAASSGTVARFSLKKTYCYIQRVWASTRGRIPIFDTSPLTNVRTVDFLQNLSLGQFNLMFGKHLCIW